MGLVSSNIIFLSDLPCKIWKKNKKIGWILKIKKNINFPLSKSMKIFLQNQAKERKFGVIIKLPIVSKL